MRDSKAIMELEKTGPRRITLPSSKKFRINIPVLSAAASTAIGGPEPHPLLKFQTSRGRQLSTNDSSTFISGKKGTSIV